MGEMGVRFTFRVQVYFLEMTMQITSEIRWDIAEKWLIKNGWSVIHRKTKEFPNARNRYTHKRYVSHSPFYSGDAVAAEIYYQINGEIANEAIQ